MHAMLKWGAPGTMVPKTNIWLRYLDYYVKLHELNDAQMMRVFKTLDELNVWDDTIIIFTSDHGDRKGLMVLVKGAMELSRNHANSAI